MQSDYSSSKYEKISIDQGIENYAHKKRQADIAMLKTEKFYLQKYGDMLDNSRIEQLYDILDDEKITLYDSENFYKKYFAADSVTGLRETQSGKISIKDTVYIDSLKKTASHEATHDVSFQKNTLPEVKHNTLDDGRIQETKKVSYQSGIHTIDCEWVSIDGKVITDHKNDKCRMLNEGLTENYNLEALRARGETPNFEAYHYERGWANSMRDIVGHAIVDRAYFGGDIQTLKDRFNNMASDSNAWDYFNECIDKHFESLEKNKYDLAKSYADKVNNILLGLEDPSEKIQEKVLKR